MAACGRAGARGAGLAFAAAPTAPHGAFRRARIAGRPRARNGSGALAAQIPALRRCRGAAGARRRASAGRLETPRAESRRRGADAGGRCLELDAGRGFRAQPSGAYEVCHRPPRRRARPGAHRSGGLRGRTPRAAARDVGLPHGAGFRTPHRPLAGVGAGYGRGPGAVAGAALLLRGVGRQQAQPRHRAHHRRREP